MVVVNCMLKVFGERSVIGVVLLCVGGSDGCCELMVIERVKRPPYICFQRGQIFALLLEHVWKGNLV